MNLFKSTKAITYISSRGDKVYPIIMDIKTGIVEGDAVFTTGDIDTAYLYTTILEEQSDYNILGSTVICNIQRPDGTTMKVQGDVLGNNLIEFPLGQSGVSQEGIYNFDIAVVFSEKKMVTSPTAQYSVTQSIEVVGEIEEDDRFPVLESLISGINVINEEELVRVSNEEVRQSKEEAREQAESVRVRNEETRLANNEAIRNEEAVRVVNEDERKNAESLRVQEEDKRKQQENTRIAQENTRVSQETARVNAENTRKNQEATRQANEATRVSQETNRSQAESTRNSNETVRQNQENTRKNQEQARVTAEGNRVTSENVRVSAEQARVLKEQERQAIEVERQNSESTREQQEATRVSQENAREQADILRQQEHESRQQFLDGFEGKLNTVVDDVAGIKDDVASVREANKRQDVFLQGLYNENLDGRVTIKEEGSVISLTNSDDGLVDVVGLEGNTLVNYVQDGAKELTLNGDIDVEGTSVTLTEGVDNGLVDVVCEGNTLVNLMPNIDYSSPNINDGRELDYFSRVFPLIQNNKTYTIVFNNYCFTEFYLVGLGLNWINIANKNIFTFTVNVDDSIFDSSSPRNFMFRTTRELTSDELMNLNFILLEGDYTNKEIPPYFEGMKSVAECEDNKIEILSQNKNLFNGEYELGYINVNTGYIATPNDNGLTTGWIKCKPNTKYIASGGNRNRWLLRNKDGKETIIGGEVGNETPIVTTLSDTTELRCYFRLNSTYEGVESVLNSFQIEEGTTRTTYTKGLLNKKQITLSEPLRATENYKDKFVKINGKWFIERNCDVEILDGTNPYWYSFQNNEQPIKAFVLNGFTKRKRSEPFVVENYPYIKSSAWSARTSIGIYNGTSDQCGLAINESELTTLDGTGVKKYLSRNPIRLVYAKDVPTYEPLETDPTLNTYNDITHISNNSTIPCNMTVKNTGYNAIIKPSTQYTVAFDTNKSGEVGINLAGSKVTTNNNVATVTTPSSLVDDSLRLTGKGIKASNVRLLEGDKTNWIPSYFEGMKSSFEEQVEEDKYKIEILSNNKNLFDGRFVNAYIGDTDGRTFNTDAKGTNCAIIRCKGGKTVSVKKQLGNRFTITSSLEYPVAGQKMDILYINSSAYEKNVVIPDNHKYLIVYVQNESNTDKVSLHVEYSDETIYNITPHKSNKIKLLINEPLRGVGDVKDRFVFKDDGKLMIERNCGTGILNGSEPWDKHGLTDEPIRSHVFVGACWHKAPVDYADNRSLLATNVPVRVDTIHANSFYVVSKTFILTIDNKELSTRSVAGLKEWLRNNPITYVYKRDEPIYEEIPHEVQKLILEGYLNGTLFLDTNIPPTVTASYTANIPVVSELNKNSNEIGLTQEDLSVTQVAVDFLLMSNIGEEMLSSFNLNTRGRNSMGAYFANRITKGALKYEDVISKYPQYKEEIDSILETK